MLNSVPADGGKMAQIKSNLADRLSRIESSFKVTVDHIRDAVQKLKVNKSDGNKGLISDMIIKAPLSWLQLLAKLVTSMFIHGYCPEVLCKATVTSLVKDPMGDLCDSNNYRGIALSSAINKIIDRVILTRSKESLQTSDLQFAYKANNSTSMCSLALKEVAAYYIQNGGNVFCTMLDASKAFDRLRYDKLFQLLEGRNLDPIIFRFLLCSYEKQLTRTRWLTETSAYFSSENGVRQGGVASPILFTVYMDELIHRLEGSHIGCYIGREFFGTLCYADDVTLLAPTVSALQHMLQVCEDFGKEYDVSYNPSKSVCLQIGGEILQTRSDVFLNGQTIKWDNSAKHLGNIINTHNSDSNDIRQKRNDFLARSNSVFVTYRAASREAKTKVFTSKCCCFYGSQTWRLTSREVEELHVTWRKAVRRLLNVPRNTRSALLPYLMSCKPFIHQLSIRFITMIKTIHKSQNSKMRWLIKICPENGPTYDNVNFVASKWNLPIACVKNGNVKLSFIPDDTMLQRAQAIIDFQNNLNLDTVLFDILYYLCTY